MKSFLIKNLPLASILFIAAILRFWNLGVNPPGLFVDEVSNGYNAYSIIKTGRDEYGNFMPLTFKAFGDYNLALSVYILVPSIAVFGLNEFAVRFPSALLGTLTVLLTYFLTKQLFKSGSSFIAHHSSQKNVALVAAFFLAISPWHLQFSRYDHEANFMLFFSILAITCFIYSHKKYPLLILSAISFGLALNTYHGAKIWIPLFLLCIFYWFKKEIISFKFKLLLPFIILAVFALPIIFNIQRSLVRGQSVWIIGKDNQITAFVSGYLSHFSPNFLFTNGDSIGRHAVPGMGELYVFEFPTIVLGLLALITAKTRNTKFLLTWLLIAPIPATLATPVPHALRAITFLPVWSIVASYGLKSFISSKIAKKLKLSLIFAVTSIGLYNFITYLHLYYNHYPKLNARDWSDGCAEVATYAAQVKDQYEVIAVNEQKGCPYIYFLFYGKYDPKAYHPQSHDKKKFDKYEFFSESWEKKTTGIALLIRPEWQIPNPPPKYLKFVYTKNNELVFRISEE